MKLTITEDGRTGRLSITPMDTILASILATGIGPVHMAADIVGVHRFMPVPELLAATREMHPDLAGIPDEDLTRGVVGTMEPDSNDHLSDGQWVADDKVFVVERPAYFFLSWCAEAEAYAQAIAPRELTTRGFLAKVAMLPFEFSDDVLVAAAKELGDDDEVGFRKALTADREVMRLKAEKRAQREKRLAEASRPE